jgi:lipopolysaccharide export system permease protein
VVATLSRMYRDSEMVIWFASGVNLARFVRPVLRMAWPVLLVVALLALFVWPWVNQRATELRERYERRSDLSRVAPGQFQTSADGTRTFFVERDPQDSVAGRNVFILARIGSSESITSARTGSIETVGDDRQLVLDRGQRNEQDLKTGDKTLSRFESYRILVGDRDRGRVDELPPRATRSIDLLRTPTLRNQGELTWRLGLLFGSANLLLLGIGLSATNPRHASNWSLLMALLGFVVYYNMINLTQAWVAGGRLGMGTALLGAHGGAFLLALLLLWWRESGNRRGLRRPGLARRAAAAT